MTGKRNQNQDEEEYEDGDFGSGKDGSASNVGTNDSNTNTTNKDGKNSDKANAMRSKHSVTEQRRRSKINERFQILRDLIPHSDQKRDTASFLLEVIKYVQYLQEKVQNFEGFYQQWSPQPTKLVPWSNSQWRVQSFAGRLQATKNGSGSVSTFPGKFDENNIAISPSLLANTLSPGESDRIRDVNCKPMERQPEIANKGMPLPIPVESNMPALVRSDDVVSISLQQPVSDVQWAECPINGDTLNPQEELTIEGGTISISSAYSEGLLNNLTQELQSAGIDLSQAYISVQIDLGKQPCRGTSAGTSTAKDSQKPSPTNRALMHHRDVSGGENSNQAQKRSKT